MKGFTKVIAIGIASFAMLVGMRSSAEDTALMRGLDWLQAQVQDNGSLSSEAASLAVIEQVRSEAAHTLAQAGRTTVLPDLSPSEISDLSTELLARRVVGLAAIGRSDDAAEVLAALMPRANEDGGFGGGIGQPSNPLDTSMSLLAMRAGGIRSDVRAQRALGYLGSAAAADGGYHLGQATYTTAYALQAFARYRNDYSLGAAIQRVRGALMQQQISGAYADTVANAVATIALAQTGPADDAAAAVGSLRNAQLPNGSWSDDPYVTALALRALQVASAAPSVDAGSIIGEVYDASSGLPVAEALVAISGVPSTALSGGTGGFALEDVPAGTYTVTVSHVGYASYTGPAVVEAGGTTNLGRIGLGLADGTAVLRGRVGDSSDASPLAGALVQVSGPLATQTLTGADGGYELMGLPAGSYSIQVSLAGYQPLTQLAELPSRTVVNYSPALTREGETPPTDASVVGTVVRTGDQEPIAGAAVTLNGLGTTTDAEGRFAFAGLAAGDFSGQVEAAGYDSVSFTGVLANGANDLGAIALAESQSPRRTLVGTVTSAATGQPIEGATLTLNGTVAAQTDAAGQYRIEDAGTPDVQLDFEAAGYQPRSASVRLENPGTYRIDAALEDLLQGSFQVLGLAVTPSSVLPGESMRITADIANLADEARPALVLVRLLDDTGTKVVQLCGAEIAGQPETCEFAFDASQVKPFAADWTVANLPAGNYTLAVHVVQPDSIQRDTPLGLVYGSASRQVAIKATLGLQGLVTSSPPVMIPGSPGGVDFSATVQNKGNDIIPAGEARLAVIDRATGTTAHAVTVAMPELLPNAIATLAFGNWMPAGSGAEYDLQVASTNPAVAGVVTGEFYVGDAASGEFAVTPTETGDGDQQVQAELTVKGVDHPSGEAADPLFTLVRQAVMRGGAYTSVQSRNWQNSNRCLGCHIQTQSLYGLASSLGKADVDQAAAMFLQNSQSASVQSDRSIYTHHPGYRDTSSMLALWSMATWPERRATFNARYRTADFLYTQRREVASSSSLYWWRDHDTGWLVENPAPTATVVEGMASVLRDAGDLGIARIHEYKAVNRAGTTARDLAAAPDGKVLTVLADGRVYAFDPQAGTNVLAATATLGANYRSIAVAADGTVYVASAGGSGKPASIERLAGSGSVIVATLPAAIDSIDVGSGHQIVTLTRSTRAVHLVDAASGSSRELARGGMLSASASTVTATAPDKVLVSDTSVGVVEISADGTMRRVHEGSLYGCYDLAVDADGRGYSGGSDAVYEVGTAGVLERFHGGGRVDRIAIAGEHVYGLNASSRQLVELTRQEIDIGNRLEQMRVAIEKAARHFETYPDYGVPAQAFRLILLAEALPHITDPVLAAKVEARIPLLAAELRGDQRADGGWARRTNYQSDPLTTAIVGTALDYTNPDSTDPVLRSTVQYLLSTQRSDGAWTGQYFTTHLGATSYVMAYLPKAVARLGGIQVGLGLDFGSDVQLLGSSVAPDSSVVRSDGSSSYFFDLGRINGTGAKFLFTLKLVGMQVDEWRKIAANAFLRFINSFNGEVVEAPIAVPTVHASSKYQLSLELNNNVFNANEDVLVQPTVRNNGSSTTSGSLRYFIETAAGGLVEELSAVAFADMSIGSERTLPQPWNTGTHAATDYRARVVLLSPDGDIWGEATAPFRILSTSQGPQLGSSVATDKPVYDPFDTVAILGKVRNLTLNSRYEQLTVTETVTTPAGAELFTADSAIDRLDASTTRSLMVPLQLVAAPAGVYTVTQTVKSFDGTVLDVQTTTFEVRSTTESGAGLSGTIAAVPPQVEVGETTSLVIGVRNEGNADLVALPLVVSVIDPAAETVLATWTYARDIAVGQSVGFAQPWETSGVAPGNYQAVLQAHVGNRLVTLAYGPVTVVEPPIKAGMTQSLSATGRLLVLMTCRIGHGAAEDLACTDDRAAFADALLTRLRIDHTVTTTTDAFAAEYATGRYDTYWISGGAQKLANTLAEELREAVFQGDGLLVDGNHDSRNQILDDALGVQFHGQLSGNGHSVATSDEFDVGTFDASGDALRYGPLSAHVRGRFDTTTGSPAFLVNHFGEGESAVAAFDLVAALAGSDSAAQAEELMVRALQGILPPTPAFGLAGGYLGVRTDVHNLAKPAQLLLRSEAVAPLAIEDARPQAEILTAALAQWRFDLGLDETRRFQLGLRLPAQPGSYLLQSSVLSASGQPPGPLAGNELTIAVATASQVASLLLQELDQLPLSAAPERNARNRVRELVAQAMTALSSGDRDAAIGHLLKAIDELAKIDSVDTTSCHVHLATLVKAARVGAVP